MNSFKKSFIILKHRFPDFTKPSVEIEIILICENETEAHNKAKQFAIDDAEWLNSAEFSNKYVVRQLDSAFETPVILLNLIVTYFAAYDILDNETMNFNSLKNSNQIDTLFFSIIKIN